MRHDGTIGVWLPAGKHAISLNGGPFFALGDVQQRVGHDLRQVDIKGGERHLPRGLHHSVAESHEFARPTRRFLNSLWASSLI